MQFSSTILALTLVAATSVVNVQAADANAVGSWTSTADNGDVIVYGVNSTPAGDSPGAAATLTPLGPITPDVSVVGSHNTAAAGAGAGAGAGADENGDGGVHVVGAWTLSEEDYSTHTYCWQAVTEGGSTSTVEVTATPTNGISPSGVNCEIVYRSGGGVISRPLPQALVAPNHNNLRIIIPVVVSIVGLILLIAGTLTFLRLRARRNARNNREWVNRAGGWGKGDLDRVQSVETAEAQVGEVGQVGKA